MIASNNVTSERKRRALTDQLGGFISYIEDPLVEDIFVNPDGSVWINKRGQRSFRILATMDSEDIRNIINLVADTNHAVCNAQHPILEAILPFRSARFEGMVPPVVTNPSFAVRLRPQRIHSLLEYVESGVMSEGHRNSLMEAVRTYKNILLVGGTGSGKTTLLNSLLQAISNVTNHDRVVSIEDTPELQCSSANYTALFSDETVSMAQCVRASLRLRPTRIIVGEVRGGEALDLLKSWNTGHPGGVTTVHANSARDGMERIEALAREATEAPQQKFIASTIQVVVYIAPDSTHPVGRRVQQVLSVQGYKGGEYQLEEYRMKGDAWC